MNKNDILNMPAGREMDKLMAESVTKLEKAKDGIWYWINGYLDECPYYSGNIGAAFEALHKWLDDNPTYAVHIETVNITTGRIHDVILWGMDDEPVYDARAEDLPLAISRVLLLAMDNKNA